MHILMACYGQPSDSSAFDEYYRSTHVPLAEKLPGLQSYTWRQCASLDDSPPPYYLVAELGFESEQAVGAALGSPEGQAAAGDIPNFATGGVTLFVQHD